MNEKKLKYETDPIKKKIGISKDLTKEEREVEFKLVKELKEKRGRGEKGWFLKNGKLLREEGEV